MCVCVCVCECVSVCVSVCVCVCVCVRMHKWSVFTSYIMSILIMTSLSILLGSTH